MSQKKSKMPPKKDASRTMDVSKPGKSSPDTTSRPVIVTNRAMVKDPTLKSEPKVEDAKTTEVTVTHGEKIINPVSSSHKVEAGSDEPTKPVENTDTKLKEVKPNKNETEKEQAKEAAVVDAVVDQATEDKKKQNKESDADIARKKAMEKLVNEKKYFVPIGQVSRRRNRRTLIVLLVIIILFVGVYLALDAKIIENNIALPVELF